MIYYRFSWWPRPTNSSSDVAASHVPKTAYLFPSTHRWNLEINDSTKTTDVLRNAANNRIINIITMLFTYSPEVTTDKIYQRNFPSSVRRGELVPFAHSPKREYLCYLFEFPPLLTYHEIRKSYLRIAHSATVPSMLMGVNLLGLWLTGCSC